VLAHGESEQIVLSQELSETAVVRNERGDDADCTTCLAYGIVGREIGDCENEERHHEAEEEHTQADRLAERGKEEQKSDATPANEVDGDGVNNLAGVGRGGIGITDAKTGDQEDRKREPEGAERREGTSSKGVAGGELPHASNELGETTTEEGHANDDVGSVDVTSVYIVQRQDERRGRKGEEAKWGGVAKLGGTVGDGVNVRSLDVRHFGRHFRWMCCAVTTKGLTLTRIERKEVGKSDKDKD